MKNKLALSDTFFIFHHWYSWQLCKKKTHAVRQIPNNTHAAGWRCSSSRGCIRNSELLSACFVSDSLPVCQVRAALTGGSFHFVNIFVPVILQGYGHRPAPSANLFEVFLFLLLPLHHFSFMELWGALKDVSLIVSVILDSKEMRAENAHHRDVLF